MERDNRRIVTDYTASVVDCATMEAEARARDTIQLKEIWEYRVRKFWGALTHVKQILTTCPVLA
jgi:hypothetical protein